MVNNVDLAVNLEVAKLFAVPILGPPHVLRLPDDVRCYRSPFFFFTSASGILFNLPPSATAASPLTRLSFSQHKPDLCSENIRGHWLLIYLVFESVKLHLSGRQLIREAVGGWLELFCALIEGG